MPLKKTKSGIANIVNQTQSETLLVCFAALSVVDGCLLQSGWVLKYHFNKTTR